MTFASAQVWRLATTGVGRNSQRSGGVALFVRFFASERLLMARCVTCGTELHPQRALKYDYCMSPECQEKNAKGLTMVAIGMNKAADEFLILDEQTQQDLATGKHRDQRRGTFGPVPGQARGWLGRGGPQRRHSAERSRGCPGRRRRRGSRSSTTSKDSGPTR